MAFDRKGFSLQYFGGASGVRVWTYTTTDDLNTVTGPGYFLPALGGEVDLRAADLIMYAQVNNVRYPTQITEGATVFVDPAGTATMTSAGVPLALRTAA